MLEAINSGWRGPSNDNSSAALLAEVRGLREDVKALKQENASLHKASIQQRGAIGVAMLEKQDATNDKLEGTRKAIRAAS